MKIPTSISVLVAFAAMAGAFVPSARSSAAEGYMIQLVSVKSEQRARDEWVRLQDRYPQLFGDLPLVLQTADLGTRGTFFRMRTGPFPNRATAEDMCWQVRAAKLDCLVLKP